MNRVLYLKPTNLVRRAGRGIKKAAAWYAAAWSLIVLIVLSSSGILTTFGYHDTLFDYHTRVTSGTSRKVAAGASLAHPIEVAQADQDEIAQAVFEGKITQVQNKILDELMHFESDGYKSLGFDSREALVTFDPDRSGKAARIPSFGPFQWKAQTVQHYWKMKTGNSISQVEAIIKAHNLEEARELARYVVFELDKGSSEWVLSFRKGALQGKVDLLAELTK